MARDVEKMSYAELAEMEAQIHSAKMGIALDWRGPEQIFRELARAGSPFEGLTYETIGTQGVEVPAAKRMVGALAT